MNASRTAITLAYDGRYEVENGVWEDEVVEKKVKAEQEQIFQRRLDQANLEGLVITARFRVRSILVKSDLKYVLWKGQKFKVNSVNQIIGTHDSIIEIGGLI